MVVRKLAFANLAVHKSRAALTVAAIALSVSLVVSVTCGYASVEAAVFKYLNQYIGTADAEIIRRSDQAAGFPEQVVARLRADPSVEDVDGRYETASVLADAKGQAGKRAALIGVRRPGDTRSEFLKMTRGRWFDTETGNVAVIDQAVAENLKVDLGGEVVIPSPTGDLRLEVVGIVHKPAMLAQFMQTVYLPIETLQDFAGKQDRVSRVDIDLRPDEDLDAFAARWQPEVAKLDPATKLKLARDTRQDFGKQFRGIQVLSYLGGAVSMLAATFIVFSALSMGVMERQRTLAMLRAVGAQKAQVGGLVILEGVLLAAAGALVGVPLGWVWVRILAWMYSDIFAAGVVVSWGGVIFGSLGSVAAALVAGFLPAWKAMRVDPLEAMNPMAETPPTRPPVYTALAGLVLIAIDPFLFFGPMERIVAAFGADQPRETARDVIFVLHFGLGLPAVMIGFFLLSPMFVWLVEKLLGPVVARLFGLPYAMLRQQLTTGIWRAAGTCAALMVGLAVLVVMQTNGHSMLAGWRLPDRFPDVFIMTGVTQGLSAEEQAQLASVPGIRPGEIMPISVASPEYGSKWFQVAIAAVMPNATMFIGIDPDKAFRMMELEFRDGNEQDAERLLGRGKHVTLADGSILAGSFTAPIPVSLATGETRQIDPATIARIEAVPPAASQPATAPAGVPPFRVTLKDGQTVEGAITSPLTLQPPKGDPVTIDPAHIRSLDTGRFLVVTEEFRELKGLGVGDTIPLKTTEGTRDFTIAGVVWSPGIDVMVSMFDMSRQFDQRTASTVFGSLESGRRFFGVQEVHLFAANLEDWYPKEQIIKSVQEKLGDKGMSIGDVREIKTGIQQGFYRILLLVSTVAFAAMAVASLGVTNTIMASVRSRRWQFGVLRSIGVTRGQLLRIVLAEAVLLGVVGVGLGLAAGFEMAVNANEMSATVTGYDPPIAVPWGIIWAGVGIILSVSLLASLFPAAAVAKAEPLSLLQAGRAAG